MCPEKVVGEKVIKLIEHIEFQPERRVRKKLLESEQMVLELLCYEPGQGTPTHHHPRQEELFYVVSGEGIINVAGEGFKVREASLVHVPANTPHSLANTGLGRLAVIFMKPKIALTAAA